MKTRFAEHKLEDKPNINSLMGEIFVACARCQSCARIVPIVSQDAWLLTPRRLMCAKCGLVREWADRRVSYRWNSSSPVDPYFHLSLWLSVSCCGKTLWFFNFQHMQFVEQYVRAELREKRKHPEYGWSNGSFFNRLPKFIKEAKNREEVLKAIENLKHKI